MTNIRLEKIFSIIDPDDLWDLFTDMSSALDGVAEHIVVGKNLEELQFKGKPDPAQLQNWQRNQDKANALWQAVATMLDYVEDDEDE